MSVATAISLAEATELIWTEADHLDRRAYDDWLELYTADAHYIVPIDPDADDYADVLNYAYDDADMRRMRVARLKSRFSMSALTAARTVRTVSRFIVTGSGPDGMTLRAAQHLVEYRRDATRTVAADVDYRLRREDGKLRIARKVVKLVNSEDAVSGIGYLL